MESLFWVHAVLAIIGIVALGTAMFIWLTSQPAPLPTAEELKADKSAAERLITAVKSSRRRMTRLKMFGGGSDLDWR